MIMALETKLEQIIIGGLEYASWLGMDVEQFWKDNPFLFWEIKKG